VVEEAEQEHEDEEDEAIPVVQAVDKQEITVSVPQEEQIKVDESEAQTAVVVEEVKEAHVINNYVVP
jgi:hypothetical protein